MPEIKRSGGTAVSGFIVGGGYQGQTAELDAAVVDAAEKLSVAYGRDVEIRFNSDQRGGGAFLVDSLPGFDGNCSVGITARLVAEITHEELVNLPTGELAKLRGTRPQHLRHAALVQKPVLRDGVPEKEPSKYGSQQVVVDCPSVAAALEWLLANVDPERIPPPPH